MLRVTIQLPPVVAPDTDVRKFFASINGVEQPVRSLTRVDGEFADKIQFEFDPGTGTNACEVWLIDVDKAGNESKASDKLPFNAADTFAPPKPGALGVVNIEEV